MKTSRLLSIALCLCLAGLASPVLAACTSTGATQTEDGRTAQIAFGRINLTSPHFQPVGSLLASVAVPPTNYTYNGANASTVLWNCALTDMPNVHFLVATNGDDRVGGYWELGAADGLPGVYGTWFAYVGIRQTMDGVVLSRYWQSVPVTNYDTQGNRALIRLGHLPVLQAELFRLNSLPPTTGAASNYCSGVTGGGGPTGLGSASAAATPYTCIQPNSYIQLVGPGLTHDNVGEDSATVYRFFGADNGFGYGMRAASTLSNNATCMARYATPRVLFPSISAQRLREGGSSEASFSVQVECSDVAVSGAGGGQTAIGIQVSPGAYQAAQSLGLVNAGGGVSALVSDAYGTDASLAQGVGVYLRRASDGQNLNFVGQPGITGQGMSTSPSGAAAGWYPVLAGATPLGSSQSGYTNYGLSYDVSLRQLTGRVAMPGRFQATAYVLVKVQ